MRDHWEGPGDDGPSGRDLAICRRQENWAMYICRALLLAAGGGARMPSPWRAGNDTYVIYVRVSFHTHTLSPWGSFSLSGELGVKSHSGAAGPAGGFQSS